MPLIKDGNYGLRKFLSEIDTFEFKERCKYCYTVRMEQTAQTAYEKGFDNFTTSLLISPYQNHDQIAEIAYEASKKYGVDFLYCDFRSQFKSGQEKAKELDLYMQKYCGCIFSEEERFRRKNQILNDNINFNINKKH